MKCKREARQKPTRVTAISVADHKAGPVNFGNLVEIGMLGLSRTTISMAEQNLSCQPIVSQKDNLKKTMSYFDHLLTAPVLSGKSVPGHLQERALKEH